jgi:hypothetical protein
MLSGGRSASGLAIPGSIITTIGVILLLQNSFGWWESWAFAWTFIIISVGAGIFLTGLRNQNEKTQRAGLIVGGIGFVLLLPFGTFFGLGFSFFGFGFAGRVIWPLMLIGAGAFLAMRGVVLLSQRSSEVSSQASLTPLEPARPLGEPVRSVATPEQNLSTPAQEVVAQPESVTADSYQG